MHDGIIISSRIRLARNVEGYPFRLQDERAALLTKAVAEKLKKIDKFTVYKMAGFESAAAVAMVERRLISPDLIKNKGYGAAAISEDERVSIMLNEEDHIREQCILGGLSLKDAYKRLSLIDRTLGGEIRFAFDSKIGYITSCPTNAGTGMRASVMMFLPALTITQTLEECIKGVSSLDMTIRGVYGEGTEASGFLYQISNKIAAGVSEQQILDSVESAAMHTVRAEKKAREFLLKTQPIEFKDKIMRSYGVLTSCYRLAYNEFLNLVAFVKLGVYYKMLENLEQEALENLITEMGPANLSARLVSKTPLERDVLRARFVREAIKKSITVML